MGGPTEVGWDSYNLHGKKFGQGAERQKVIQI